MCVDGFCTLQLITKWTQLQNGDILCLQPPPISTTPLRASSSSSSSTASHLPVTWDTNGRALLFRHQNPL